MDGFFLPAQVRQALINYLSGRPWVEVHDGITALLQLDAVTLPQTAMTFEEEVIAATGDYNGDRGTL